MGVWTGLQLVQPCGSLQGSRVFPGHPTLVDHVASSTSSHRDADRPHPHLELKAPPVANLPSLSLNAVVRMTMLSNFMLQGAPRFAPSVGHWASLAHGSDPALLACSRAEHQGLAVHCREVRRTSLTSEPN